MPHTYVTSDTHFGHKQILTWQSLPPGACRGEYFDSIDSMNWHLEQNWNAVVQPEDTVYHLGDVFMLNNLFTEADAVLLWRRLNGHKHLVLGNHDDALLFAKHGLVESISLIVKMPKLGVVLSHMPMHPRHMYEMTNVHGHLHSYPPPSPRHCCVSVEQTEYRPVLLQSLLS